jgi:hypothetical protein
MHSKQFVLIFLCLVVLTVAQVLGEPKNNLNNSKYKVAVIERDRMIVYFLAASASKTKIGGVGTIPCTPDREGNELCLMFCEIEGYRDGYCTELKDGEYICRCSR